MTDKTKKHEERPAKVNFFELLKQKRALLITLKKEIETQAAVRKNNLSDAINAALGVRRNAVSELRKSAESKQKAHKDAYDLAKAAALKKYEDSLAAITKAREDDLAAAHKAKEDAYTVIRDELEKLEAPHIEKHKTSMKTLQESYEQDEPGFKAEGEKAIKAVLDDIKDLEEEIAAKRQRTQPAPAAPSATP